MKVKICGICTQAEAINVARFQPDAIGILVGFGMIAPNDISLDQAKHIVETKRVDCRFGLPEESGFPILRKQ